MAPDLLVAVRTSDFRFYQDQVCDDGAPDCRQGWFRQSVLLTPLVFSPLCDLKAVMPEEGVCDHGHLGVTVQPFP